MQDLHGQSYPWPSGGGVNKVAINSQYESHSTANGLTLTFNDAAESVTISGTVTAANARMYSQNITDVLSAGGTWTISRTVTDGTTDSLEFIVNESYDGSTVNRYVFTSGQNSITYESGHNYYLLIFNKQNTVGNTVNCTVKFQLEAGSTKTDWKPYTNVCPISGWTGMNVVVSPTDDAEDGTTYPISWETEAGTVYCGTLDVTTGVLTVTHTIVDLSTKTWNIDSDAPSRFRTRDTNFLGSNGWDADWKKITSNAFRVVNPSTPWSNVPYYSFCNIKQNYYNFNIRVPSEQFNDPTIFKNWLANVDGNNTHAIVNIPVITPTIIQLTAQELESLFGQNYVWCTTGNTTVTYYANTKLYIDKKVAEAVAALGGG